MLVWLWRLHAGTVQRAIVSAASLVVLVRAWVFAQLHLISPAWFDLWLWVADYRRWVEGSYTLHDLVKAHYDSHRIVTTRLLLLLDSIFFDMNGRSVVTVNLLVLAALGILLWRLARTDEVARTTFDVPPLFWVALISSVAQLDNLIAPFQVQFAITCASAAGAAWLLSGAAREPRARRAAWQAALAGGLGIVAAFSMASGVLVAPAMLAVLALRHARMLAWAVFVPLSVAGVALFFHHYPQSGHPALLDWHNTLVRVLYVGNFLAAGLTALPRVATAAGLVALALFTLVTLVLVRDFTWRGLALPRGDAGLVGLGLFVAMCGPAATMTFRLTFGPEGALVGRYGTMSLLFAAVLFGLLIRWGARTATILAARSMTQALAVPAAGLGMLLVFNLPSYDFRAGSLRNVAVADAEMVVNNVGVEGPGPIIFGGLDENPEVRGEAGFLHDHRLNMFAPENRLPAVLLAHLRGADLAALPHCRGFVDDAYAIDSGAFLLRGWAVDAGGGHSAPWIAAVDQSGLVLGSARALEPRPDVQQALGLAGAAHGFNVGFRLSQLRVPGNAAAIRVVGVFPNEAAPLCALASPVSIGPALIEPVREVRGAAPAPLAAAAQVNGWAPWSGGSDGPPGGIPGGGTAWCLPLPGQWTGRGSVRFEVGATGGHALAVPFATVGDLPVRQIGFTMADGTRLDMPMPKLWGRPDWRAAILPAAFLARHPGPVRVEITAAGDRWVVVAAPILVELQPEWSRLY